MKQSLSTGLASLALVAALAGSAPSLAGSEPIPGVDIIVEKNPGGSKLTVGSVGRDNQFAGELRLAAGTYVIGTACKTAVRCPAHALARVSVGGKNLTADSRGVYSFSVAEGTGRPTAIRGAIKLLR